VADDAHGGIPTPAGCSPAERTGTHQDDREALVGHDRRQCGEPPPHRMSSTIMLATSASLRLVDTRSLTGASSHPRSGPRGPPGRTRLAGVGE
jgi:hypothetical protein